MNVYIINLILYLGLFIYLFKSKLPGKVISMLICGLFCVSATASLLYYDSSLYFLLTERKNSPSIMALLYVFIGFVIYLIPLAKTEQKSISHLPRYGILIYLTIFLGIVAIIPAIENCVRLSNMDVTDMADAYNDMQGENGIRDTRSHFSAIGRVCNGIVSWFSYLTPTLFFYTLFLREKNIVILLAFAAFINPILPTFFYGGRGAVFHLFFVLILNYLIFRNCFSEYTKKLVSKFGVVVCFFIAILLISMSIARSGDDADTAFSQMYRYVGEGFVNFSETGWFVSNHTNGHSIINGTGNTIMSQVSEFFDGRDYRHLGMVTGIRMYVYYTVFGDYFLDFGMLGGIIYNIILSSLFFFSIRNGIDKISSIILLNMYAKIGFNGIYCYAYMNYLEYLLWSLLCVYIIRKIEDNYDCHFSNSF